MNGYRIISLDGHDGSGKTTLSKNLANNLGCYYLRPFSGSAGELMLWSAENGDQEFSEKLARKQIDYAFNKTPSKTVIMDRCWLTLFTFFSPELRKAWDFRPATVLCYADLQCTQRRLAERKQESQKPTSYHDHYLKLYKKLAAQYNCPVLRTDQLDEQECMEKLLSFSKKIFVN